MRHGLLALSLIMRLTDAREEADQVGAERTYGGGAVEAAGGVVRWSEAQIRAGSGRGMIGRLLGGVKRVMVGS